MMSQHDYTRTASAKRRTIERRIARTAKRQARLVAAAPVFTRVEVTA